MKRKTDAEQVTEIVEAITGCYPCFGGGQVHDGNPISCAMADRPAVFALGVPVREIVKFVRLYPPPQAASKRKKVKRGTK